MPSPFNRPPEQGPCVAVTFILYSNLYIACSLLRNRICQSILTCCISHKAPAFRTTFCCPPQLACGRTRYHYGVHHEGWFRTCSRRFRPANPHIMSTIWLETTGSGTFLGEKHLHVFELTPLISSEKQLPAAVLMSTKRVNKATLCHQSSQNVINRIRDDRFRYVVERKLSTCFLDWHSLLAAEVHAAAVLESTKMS